MKYEKLIIISTVDIDNRIATLFSVDNLLREGIAMEYWNITDITFHEAIAGRSISDLVSKRIRTYDEFRNEIAEQKEYNPLFITYFNYCYKTSKCYRILANLNCHTLYCVTGVFPHSKTRLIHQFSVVDFLKRIVSRVVEFSILIKPAKFELLTCKLANLDFKYDKSTKILGYNTTDFVLYQECDDQIVINYDYYVFIDVYIPYHPDVLIAGYQYIDDERYFKQLNQCFKRIESSTGCKVVVAAHPAAICYKDKNPFEGRDVLFGKTIQLVKYSRGAISHFSTALSFIALYYKKLIILSSDEIQQKFTVGDETALLMSKLMGCNFYNIDHLPESITFSEVDKEKYDEYKYNYVVNKESEKKTNLSILLSILRDEL